MVGAIITMAIGTMATMAVTAIITIIAIELHQSNACCPT
jgi:hypothetical protein